MSLLDRDRSLLLVIDAQERFYDSDRADVDVSSLHRLFDKIGWMVAVADAIGVPVVVTEEEADRHGATDTRISTRLPVGTPVLDKAFFGAPSNPEIMAAIAHAGRDTVVLVGMETDVCVAHTALLLLDLGYRVAVASDCLYSPGESHDAGLRRLAAGGVEMLSAKGVFYDWVRGVVEWDRVIADDDFLRHPPGFHL